MENKQLFVVPNRLLSVGDTLVTSVAGKMRMNPARLVEKIQAVIPNPAEQHAYLVLAQEFGLRPRRFVHILRRTLNHRELRLSDFREVEMGPNITFSYGHILLQEIRLAIYVSSSEAQSEFGYQLTSATAAEIVSL